VVIDRELSLLEEEQVVKIAQLEQEHLIITQDVLLIHVQILEENTF